MSLSSPPCAPQPARPAAVQGRTRPPRRVIVVGAGVAGLTCAMRLARQGVETIVLETRKKAGGRATSFRDVRSGRVLDNCQHVVLGCCRNFRRLLTETGQADALAWTSALRFVEEGGRTSVLAPGPLPAPGHFALSFARARFLASAEKLAVARCALATLRTDRRRWRGRVFAEFLRRCGQPQRVVDRFWAPVVVSACNLSVERVCAEAALHVFQEGFFARRDAARMGAPRVPLAQLYDPILEQLRQRGGQVRLGVSVVRACVREVETAQGERLEADAVVLAVPAERVSRIVDESLQRVDPRFASLARLEHSPIVGAHLDFDGPVLPCPHASLVERPTQWLFRKDDQGRRVHAVVSAADALTARTEEEIAQLVEADVRACFPKASRRRVVFARVVREKRATFALTPDFAARRPSTTGPSGLILAGDYVDTGWPATMEGACISGEMAAAAALGLKRRAFVLEQARAAPLAQLLAPG